MAAYLLTAVANAAGPVPPSSLSTSDGLLPVLPSYVSARVALGSSTSALHVEPVTLAAADTQSAGWRTIIGAWNALLMQRLRMGSKSPEPDAE